MRDLTPMEAAALKLREAADALAWCARELPVPKDRAHARKLMSGVKKLTDEATNG